MVAGGIPIAQQVNTIKDGVDIVTCTPGRIRDLVNQDIISLEFVRFFVLDEADSLFAQSDGARTIRDLHQKMSKYTSDGQRLQMVVCSATLHNKDVKRLAVSDCLLQ